ncbi:MAG: efflux RND transporter permease subunit [Pseudomonadales bacterium]|nr:efflux RND transporter permease subunit [Pseudomonadales bacterium]
MNQQPIAHQGIVAWMAHNPVAANLLMLVVFLLGLFSVNNIKKEVFPTFPAEVLTIVVPYPGGSPEEVEESILLKVEEAIEDIDGLKEIRSQATSSAGTVTVIINPGQNINDILNKVTVRVNGISSFPANAEKPIITERLSRSNVIRLSVYGALEESQLKELADEIRNELLATDEITQVDIGGTRNYEISLELSKQQLLKHHLSFDDVVTAIRAQSINLPSGIIRSDNGTLSIRTENQAYDASAFKEFILISRADGTRIKLEDIATIKDGFEEQPILSELNGFPAINLSIYSIGKQNALDISERVNRYAEEKSLELPKTVKLAAWADRSRILKSRINLLLKNAVQGGILVMITLALFLHPAVALWVILGVPFAFLGTLFLIGTPLIDVSINVISLFGFILVLGIVVDDAIITAESAYAVLEEEDQGIDSVLKGVKRVTQATVFGVITTVIAFSPMLFVQSGMGRLFSVMSPVVILCLILSLVETKLILPAHLKHVRTKPKPESEAKNSWVFPLNFLQSSLAYFSSHLRRIQQAVNQGMQAFIKGVYLPLLNTAVQYRYITTAIFLSMLIVTAAMLPSGWVRFVFFPNVPSDTIRATLEMPVGTSYKLTHAYAERISAAAITLNDELVSELNSDSNVIRHTSTESNNDTQASFLAELTPSTEREVSSIKIANRWRELVGELPGIKELSFEARIGHIGSAIDIQIRGEDLQELRSAAKDLSQGLQGYEGVFDVHDTFGSGGTEIHIKLNHLGESLGLKQQELARQVRQAIFGAEIQRVQRGRHEVRVYTRYPEADRNSIDTLHKLWVRLPSGADIPFNKVATLESKPGISTIYRMNRQRTVNVKADVDKTQVEPGQIVKQLHTEIFPKLLQKYPSIHFVLEGEAKDQSDNIEALSTGFAIVLILIYAALAIPLRSYFQPLYIMSAIPFGMVGAIIGHYLTGKSLSILSIIGIIALSGIVVNDALVLVDDINQRIKSGVPKLDAVIHAGERRFRAVILTSLTTFMSLIPLLLEKSIQAQFLIPMATSVAFGVLFATSVTLILLPVLFYVIDDITRFFTGSSTRNNKRSS